MTPCMGNTNATPGLSFSTSMALEEGKAIDPAPPDLARLAAMTLHHAVTSTADALQPLLATANAVRHVVTAIAVHAPHRETICSEETTGTIVTATGTDTLRLRAALLLLHGTGIVVRFR